MDTLLRYLLFNFALGVLWIELWIVVGATLLIILIKLGTRFRARRSSSIQAGLAKIIETTFFDTQKKAADINIPRGLRKFRFSIELMEKYDQRFSDQRWKEIKAAILDLYLLGMARKHIKSHSWFKRQLAARCLLLAPEKAQEVELRQLLHDSRYLVRVVAAACITHTAFHHLFGDMIKVMSGETSLSQFPYRDALLQMDQEKFSQLEEMLRTEIDPKVIAICLDVLSTRYTTNLLPLVKPFLKAEDQKCRLLAIKALGNVAQEEAGDLLEAHLTDADWEIRAEAVNSLQKLYVRKAIPRIKPLLNDSVWWVRLQAALALKSFGPEGRNILSKQNKVHSPEAFEIAQYALALP